MSERAYPITEEQQLKRRILTPPPQRAALFAAHRIKRKQRMVMKIRLRWYEKHSDDLKADEYSADIDDGDNFFETLGLSEETAIYADVFNVLPSWITTLQPHFKHMIDPTRFDYQISFRYQGAWPPPPPPPPPPPKQPKNL